MVTIKTKLAKHLATDARDWESEIENGRTGQRNMAEAHWSPRPTESQRANKIEREKTFN